MDDVTIGKNLATLRTAAGMAQGDLAVRIGVAQQTIAKIEKGARPLKYSEAVSVSTALGVPISALSAHESTVDSSAKLLEAMDRIDQLEPGIAGAASHLAPRLVKLASLVAAITFGRLDQPSDWASERKRAMAFLETDWGADVLNWHLTRGVRERCLDRGMLSDVDAPTYQEILAKIVSFDIAGGGSADGSAT